MKLQAKGVGLVSLLHELRRTARGRRRAVHKIPMSSRAPGRPLAFLSFSTTCPFSFGKKTSVKNNYAITAYGVRLHEGVKPSPHVNFVTTRTDARTFRNTRTP